MRFVDTKTVHDSLRGPREVVATFDRVAPLATAHVETLLSSLAVTLFWGTILFVALRYALP